MQLHSAELNNFRCFDKTSINFEQDITVFVGTNGSGKTSILDAISILLIYLIYALHLKNNFPNTLSNINDFKSINKNINLFYNIKFNDNTFINYNITSFINKDFKVEEEINKLISVNEQIEKKLSFLTQKNILFVYYRANRILGGNPSGNKQISDIWPAYHNAFHTNIDFFSTLSWFIEKSSEEALTAVRKKNLSYTIPELDAVRKAVSQALGDYNEPYVDKTPPQLFICSKNAPDIPLSVEQLSDGYRTMLALIMDLARRMAIANAHVHWDDETTVLHSPGIVLIDEIELHLHPSWQQSVLPTLHKIFPNVQFIVTTHSPQVLTSIEAKNIRILDHGTLHSAPQGTWGADASRVLKRVLGVDSRPPSLATDQLKKYMELVYADKWDSEEAKKLRAILDARYGSEEPELLDLDLYIDNRKWEQQTEDLSCNHHEKN